MMTTRHYIKTRIEVPSGQGTRRSPLTYRWTTGYIEQRDGQPVYPAVTRLVMVRECKADGVKYTISDE